MARHESEREDLLREATALVERVELKILEFEEPVIIGFRREGAASVFFGADPVYQFNPAGELRRAYVGGILYKAERRRLIALRREQSDTEVVLFRRELDDAETAAFLSALDSHLSLLKAAFSQSSFSIVGQVPNEGDIIGRVRLWLDSLPPRVAVAAIPNVR
jgi:hypothetical protein